MHEIFIFMIELLFYGMAFHNKIIPYALKNTENSTIIKGEND